VSSVEGLGLNSKSSDVSSLGFNGRSSDVSNPFIIYIAALCLNYWYPFSSSTKRILIVYKYPGI
jgi:hypothetical protein